MEKELLKAIGDLLDKKLDEKLQPIKEEVGNIKQEVENIKEEIKGVKEQVISIDNRLTKVEIKLENIEYAVKLGFEGQNTKYDELNRKIDENNKQFCDRVDIIEKAVIENIKNNTREISKMKFRVNTNRSDISINTADIAELRDKVDIL